jgi:hypothetical protein
VQKEQKSNFKTDKEYKSIWVLPQILNERRCYEISCPLYICFFLKKKYVELTARINKRVQAQKNALSSMRFY